MITDIVIIVDNSDNVDNDLNTLMSSGTNIATDRNVQFVVYKMNVLLCCSVLAMDYKFVTYHFKSRKK